MRLMLLCSAVSLIFLFLAFIPIGSAAGCPSDTIFVVDSTGSVAKIFDDEKKFVQTVVNQLDVGPNASRVALIVYSSRRRNAVLLSLKGDQSRKGMTMIGNAMPFFNGVTATGAALSATLRELENRRGSQVPANIVVVTDGFSYDRVAEQSAKLRSLPNVRTFAVSIGEFHQRAELIEIAGAESNVFIGANSTAALADSLRKCGQGQNPMESPKVETKEPNSESEEKQNRKEPKKPKEEKPTPKEVPKSEENPYELEEHPKPKPQATTQKPGEDKYESPDVTKRSTDSPTSTTSAPTAKSTTTAAAVSTTTKSTTASTTTKSTTAATTTALQPRCSLDVVFVLDVSSSVNSVFEGQKKLSTELFELLAKKVDDLRAGIVKFSGNRRARVIAKPASISVAEFGTALNRIQNTGGTTYITDALKQVTAMVENRKTVVLVITDGFVADDPTVDAKALQQKATVFIIPSAKDFPVNRFEFKNMASQEKYAFMDGDMSLVQSAVAELTAGC